MSADSEYDPPRELRALLGALCDGHLDEEESARLDEILSASAAARRTYLRYLDLHVEIGHRFELEGAALGTTGQRAARPRSRRLLPALAAMAAVLGVSAGLVTIFRLLDGAPAAPGAGAVIPPAENPESGAAVAIIGSAVGVVWNRDDVSPEIGVSLRTGAYALTEGELGLGFVNGAEVTIGAPADFVIVSPLEIYMTEGRVAAQVPASASGFTIRSKDMALVDIGTAFAMNVKPTGVSRVLVREGEVVASVLGKNGTTLRDYRATAGDGFEIDAAAVDIRAMDMGAESFVQPFELQLPELRLAPGYAEAVRASAPLAFWSFETLPGGNTGSFRAFPFGTCTLDASRSNPVALFPPGDGMSGLFVSDPLPGLNRRGYSIEFWMNARAIQYSTLVGLIQPGWAPPRADGNETAAPDYLSVIELTADNGSAEGLIQRSRSVRFLHRSPPESASGVNVFSESSYQPLRWTHVVAVEETGVLRLYLDGKLDQEVKHSSPTGDESYQMIVGRLRPPVFRLRPRQFSGGLDELALYDRPLTPEEVAAHYEAAGPR